MVYALVLTTATHWPALELGTAQHPAPDKLLHLLAFGALALSLWLTGWVGSIWKVVVIVVIWAALDELSQSIPALHRTLSIQDMAAGQLGAVLTGLWCRALRPAGRAFVGVAIGLLAALTVALAASLRWPDLLTKDMRLVVALAWPVAAGALAFGIVRSRRGP